MLLKLVPAPYLFTSETRNGIISKSKRSLGSMQAVSFVRVKDQEEKISEAVFVGMQVDVYDNGLKKWLPAIIGKFLYNGGFKGEICI